MIFELSTLVVAMAMVTLSSTRFPKKNHSLYKVMFLHKRVGIKIVKIILYGSVDTWIIELKRKETKAIHSDMASGKFTDMPPITLIETIWL